MTENLDLTLLYEYFDRTLPVTNLVLLANKVVFDLFEYHVELTIEPCNFNPLAEWILNCSSLIYTGYIIDIRFNGVTDITNINHEFLVLRQTLEQLDQLVENLRWEFLIFRGLEQHRNKLIEAIAQRMTRLQPDVERIAARQHLYLIARF